MSARVDALVKSARKVWACTNCPHSNQWHARTETGHVKIGGGCQFPQCGCRGYRSSKLR